jgi:hypothetical protein
MTKDEVLARIAQTAPKAVKVETKLSGDWHMVRPNGARRWVLLDLQAKLAKGGQFRIPPAAVVATAVCDEAGAALFGSYDEAYDAFSQMEFAALEELYEQALEITGLGKRSLEDAEKKSSSSQS